jgi:hypothetical protein
MIATGDLAPGAPFDARFTDLRTVGITNDGMAVIWGATEGQVVIEGVPGIAVGAGLWTWNSTDGVQLMQILGAGFDAERIAVGADGRVVLAAEELQNDDRLLECHVGEVGCTLLAMSGDTAAGMPEGWTLRRFTSIDLDASSTLVFTASIDTGDPLVGASGVFAFGDEAVLVAATGDALADPSAALLDVSNSHVHAAANAITFASGVPSLPDGYGYSWDPFALRPVLLARWTPQAGLEGLLVGGEPAPGSGTGETFVAPSAPRYEFEGPGIVFDVGADGTTAFAAWMSPSDDQGVWVCGAGSSCSLRIREGDPIPDRGDGSLFKTEVPWEVLFEDISVAPDGTIVFAAAFATPVDGFSRSGVFAIDPAGALRTLASSGDAVPETFHGFALYAVSPQNRVLFGNYFGLYTSEPDGQVRAVMHLGDPLDPATPNPRAEAFYLDASDAAVEHVALRVLTELRAYPARQEPTLLFETLAAPESGAIASAAVSALVLAILARRRS